MVQTNQLVSKLVNSIFSELWVYPSVVVLSPPDPGVSQGGPSSSSEEPALDDSSSLSASADSLGLELENTAGSGLWTHTSGFRATWAAQNPPHLTGWLSRTQWASSSPSLPSLHRFILVSKDIWRQPVYTICSSSHRPCGEAGEPTG